MDAVTRFRPSRPDCVVVHCWIVDGSGVDEGVDVLMAVGPKLLLFSGKSSCLVPSKRMVFHLHAMMKCKKDVGASATEAEAI